MQIVDRLGTYGEVRAASGALAPVMDAIRATVADIHPGAFETASRKERSVWWGWGEAKMTEGYVYAMAHPGHVNLGFFQGVHLPDPERRLEGTGKALRHVKLQSPEAALAPEIRALICAARDEREKALAGT